MKQIYKILISIFLIMMLVTMLVDKGMAQSKTEEINDDIFSQAGNSNLYMKVCCIDEDYTISYGAWFMLPVEVEVWDKYLNPINASVTIKVWEGSECEGGILKYKSTKWTGSNKKARFGFKLPPFNDDRYTNYYTIVISAKDKYGNWVEYLKKIDLSEYSCP